MSYTKLTKANVPGGSRSTDQHRTSTRRRIGNVLQIATTACRGGCIICLRQRVAELQVEVFADLSGATQPGESCNALRLRFGQSDTAIPFEENIVIQRARIGCRLANKLASGRLISCRTLWFRIWLPRSLRMQLTWYPANADADVVLIVTGGL